MKIKNIIAVILNKVKKNSPESMKRYAFKRNTWLSWWRKMLIPILLLGILAGFIFYFKVFTIHDKSPNPEFGIFFTMLFVIISGVVIRYMWSIHEDRVNAENMFDFIAEQLGMLLRKHEGHSEILEKATEDSALYFKDASHILDCIKIWEDNQEKYYQVFFKHPYFSIELKQIIFLSFMEIYMFLRLSSEKMYAIACLQDDINYAYTLSKDNPAIPKIMIEIKGVLANAQKQIPITRNTLKKCMPIINEIKKDFSTSFDLENFDKGFESKADALLSAYVKLRHSKETKEEGK
jgi:hypothetical protein